MFEVAYGTLVPAKTLLEISKQYKRIFRSFLNDLILFDLLKKVDS